MLNKKGQCCGRKPLEYKSSTTTSMGKPHRFCDRCDRAYGLNTDEQLENWAWEKGKDGEFRRK